MKLKDVGDLEIATLGKYLVVGAFIVLVIIACGIVIYNAGRDSGAPAAQTTLPTPAATPMPSVPTTITYEVQSTTTSGGVLLVITVDGRSLVMPDYPTWDNQIPGDWYTAQQVSTDAQGRIYVTVPNLVSEPVPVYGNDYPHYYYYQNRYWQDDGHNIDRVSYKEIRGEYVRYGQPPECAGTMVCG